MTLKDVLKKIPSQDLKCEILLNDDEKCVIFKLTGDGGSKIQPTPSAYNIMLNLDTEVVRYDNMLD